MTLMELTNHEAGIILYGGNTVAVCNWMSCGDDQIPAFGPIAGLQISWPEEPGVFDGAESHRFSDVRNELPGRISLTGEVDGDGAHIVDTDMDIVSDDNNDLLRLFMGQELGGSGKPLTAEDYEGTCYTLRDGRKILVLDLWN